MKRTAAFFDFDKTLLTVESAKPGLRYLYERGEVTFGFVLSIMFANVFFQRHLISEKKMGLLMLRLYRGKLLEKFEMHAVEFYNDRLKPLLARNILSCVEEHRQKGHVLVLVSGSVRYFLRPVVEDLGFDHLLCTDLEVKNGLLTGKTEGRICIDIEKRIQVEKLAEQENLDLFASYAYGNHQSDIPLLDLVGHAFVVKPTRPLKKTALDRGWPILSFA
ncbi:MAG: HAD family hydrolase [Deltaproteobacteria bacterium]|nr:HAD family hydrolase [Deltaproteobacteria bacterium]